MSGFVNEILAQERERVPGAEVWRGIIGKTATFETANERLPVIIPAFANNLLLPVLCRWQPRVVPKKINLAEPSETERLVELCVVVYPQKGNACLIAFDENDEPWIIHYTPEGA